MIRKAFIALAATAIALGTSACNTVKGLGKDIQSVGEAGDRAIR
jgi:predicted small secreted protein